MQIYNHAGIIEYPKKDKAAIPPAVASSLMNPLLPIVKIYVKSFPEIMRFTTLNIKEMSHTKYALYRMSRLLI